MNLAPIVLFTYNRLWHTQQTIEALQKNELAKDSDLIIYSDGANDKRSRAIVQELRDYFYSIGGFRSIVIIERDKNWGLADSIIDGVTSVVNEYGKVIVLEDDLVTSPYFLKFMNEALEFYRDEEKVWHISGWNYPIETDGLNNVFLWRVMNCWGWATWDDKWNYYEKNVDKTIKEFTYDDIKKFNLDGKEDFWAQIAANKENKINTWAIFWYATIFKQHGLCLNPCQTYVENIGHDGSGMNCGTKKNHKDILNFNKKVNYLVPIKESIVHVNEIQKYMKKSIFTRLKRFIRWK